MLPKILFSTSSYLARIWRLMFNLCKTRMNKQKIMQCCSFRFSIRKGLLNLSPSLPLWLSFTQDQMEPLAKMNWTTTAYSGMGGNTAISLTCLWQTLLPLLPYLPSALMLLQGPHTAFSLTINFHKLVNCSRDLDIHCLYFWRNTPEIGERRLAYASFLHGARFVSYSVKTMSSSAGEHQTLSTTTSSLCFNSCLQ